MSEIVRPVALRTEWAVRFEKGAELRMDSEASARRCVAMWPGTQLIRRQVSDWAEVQS